MRIAVIFGTRPEAIKLAPIVLAMQRDPMMDCRVCVTGQHRFMLDQVLAVFGINPDVDLDLMQPSQTLAALTGRVIEAVDKYLCDDNPQLVLVQGDTTTVLCAALAAFYRKIPVGHVEAGLRTWDLRNPWPEEANRVLASRIANLHFAPTESARQNLLREGVPDEAITDTGNTVIDALFLAMEKVRATPPVIPGLPEILQPLRNSPNCSPRVVLITGHRRESFGQTFENICYAIARLAQLFPDVHFVYPVHLNPNVYDPVMRILGTRGRNQKSNQAARMGEARISTRNNVHLIEPLSYLQFVALMDRASLILTDSGGVQEEAPSLGKPVLVMRETTERPEAVNSGSVRLVGLDYHRIVSEVSNLLTNTAARDAMANKHNPYGDGIAAPRIVKACREFLHLV